MTRTLTLLAALLIGTAAQAHEFKIGDLEIIHPNIPAPAANASTAAGYFTIINHGKTADTLTGVSADFSGMAMLHESRIDAAGVSTMSHLSSVPIPAGATVEFAPSGLHIMFMDLKGPVTKGEMLPGTLTFEKAGTVAVGFEVEKPGTVHVHN